MENRGKEEKDVCVRIKRLKNLLVVEDLEFFLIGFDGKFAVWVFTPENASWRRFRIKRFDIGAGLEGGGEDDGFGADHVEDEWDSPKAVTELFPKVAGESGFSSGAEDKDADGGGIDGCFSEAVDSLRGWMEGICAEG